MPAVDDGSLATYAQIAVDFLRRWGHDVQQEARWFGAGPKTLTAAIERACLSAIPSGRGGGTRRHSHQCRIPYVVLADAKAHLLARADDLAGCANFAELFAMVEGTIQPIPGVGELLVYDIAQRIGWSLGFEPEAVYLHTGTRSGARALGLAVNRKAIPIAEMPAGLRRLSGAQLEDVLCIYRGALQRIAAGARANAPPRRC